MDHSVAHFYAEVKKLIQDCEIVLAHYKRLKRVERKLGILAAHQSSMDKAGIANPLSTAPIYAHDRRSENDALINFVLFSMKAKGRQLSLQEIVHLLEQSGLIPIHLLDGAAYVKRALNRACSAGRLKITIFAAPKKNVYSLVE